MKLNDAIKVMIIVILFISAVFLAKYTYDEFQPTFARKYQEPSYGWPR